MRLTGDDPFTFGILVGYLLVGHTLVVLDLLGLASINLIPARCLSALGIILIITHYVVSRRAALAQPVEKK